MMHIKTLLPLCLLAATLASECDTAPMEQAEEADDLVQLLQERVDLDLKRRKASPAMAESLAAQREAAVTTLHAAVASESASKISYRNIIAEFIAMTLFVFFGCGSAMSIAKEEGSAWVLQVSLTFGLAITVLAYTVGHYSGAQINCAVTLGLVIYGHLGVVQGILNFLAQMVGSVLGAVLLKAMYPAEKDKTGGLGTNGIAPGWTSMGALVGEFVGTFLLMFVVFETAVNSMGAANAMLAPLAIGLAVFLAHSVLIPVDGCSINPTRTFGPALVEAVTGNGDAFKDMWVFWIGPLCGAASAAGVYALMS